MTDIGVCRLPRDEKEFDAMAIVLEGRHGRHAAEIADFFSSFHCENGDDERSDAWADVAERVRERERERIECISDGAPC
jgi:hypothetical protein